MKAIREDGTASMEDSIDRTGQARADRLHPVAEVERCRRLHDHVDVVDLHRVVHDAKPTSLASCAQRLLERSDEANGA
jgi:hypothetical protein